MHGKCCASKPDSRWNLRIVDETDWWNIQRDKDVYLRCLRTKKVTEAIICINSLVIHWHSSKQQSHLQQKHLDFPSCFLHWSVNLHTRSLEHGLSAQCGDLVIFDQSSTVYDDVSWGMSLYWMKKLIGIAIIINCLWLLFDLFFLHVLHPGWGNGCCSKLTEPGWTCVAVPSIG